MFAGNGEDCDELTKENRECVTMQLFTNFKGNPALCQGIFSRSCHNSHMCSMSAAEKILNLLISVNDKGCNDHTTLHAAYKELEKVIDEKGLEKPISIIADGHKSRFDAKTMQFCEDASMAQLLLLPHTSGITQLHDQVNNKLHKQYEEKKDENYCGCCDINMEDFITILERNGKNG